MDLLEPLSVSDACELHRISGSPSGIDSRSGIRDRLLISTPETRTICNRPEVVGIDYTNRLRTAMTAALSAISEAELLPDVPEAQHCVLHFLRGSLNFGLREALHESLGSRRPASAFLSSQRVERDGAWSVSEDGYRKLNVPDGALLFCGDVVATGVTLERGLETLLHHLEANERGLHGIVFFTIGGSRIEDVLAGFDERLQERWPGYRGATIVYIEARFAMAEADTPLRLAVPGTDLLRTGGLLSPRLAASQWDAVSYPLERCGIYDAGSRAFDVPTYLEDVRSYWRAVAGLAAEGWSLADALDERWPTWEQAPWQVPGDHDIRSPDALAAVAIDRLERLR